MTAEFAALLKLDRAERLQLVEDLWDSIAQEDSADLPLADWKRDEILQRRQRLVDSPDSGRSWTEVERHARE
jgi:putative addiction module component (TIGR02574 family)